MGFFSEKKSKSITCHSVTEYVNLIYCMIYVLYYCGIKWEYVTAPQFFADYFAPINA